MVKKLRIILGLVFIVALCAGLSACKTTGELEKYDVLVYYDSNGGTYYDRTGVTIVDGFRFSDYEADADGNYSFSLIEPTSSSRPGSITLTKTQSFFAGWYKTRTALTDAQGNLLDKENRRIEEQDGVYYVSDTLNSEEPVVSEPVYEYSDRWDFATDKLKCNPDDGKTELRLYAGWVSYYFFDYYVQQNGEWVKYGETYFNYSIVKPDSAYADYDTVWLPEWSDDGIMNHVHTRSDNSRFEFPKVEGCTFVAAYEDVSCSEQSKIDGSVKHGGSLDLETARPINSVKNIYVVVEGGEQYRISTAEQLLKNVNVRGHYTILNDLDFTRQRWPAAFVTGTFTGKFTAEEGKTVTITGAEAKLSSQGASYGGLFGKVGLGAVIKGITFKNVLLDVSATYNRQIVSFALFSGEIDAQAVVSGVTVDGTVRLGQIYSGSTVTANMLVCGDNKGGVTVSADGIKLQVSGEERSSYYSFTVSTDRTTVADDGAITVSFATSRDERQKSQEIYDITIWRQNND